MSPEQIKLLQLAALVFLGAIFLLWIYAYYHAKRIVAYLRQRHPTRWEELDKPVPDYFSSMKLQTWNRFLSGGGHRSLNDSRVDDLCERQIRLERTAFAATLLFFLVFGGIALWDKYA